MSSVFQAHSSVDKRFVRRLAADLLERGVRVWFDEGELLVGDSLFAKIGDAIREMDYLAVILSPASVKSPWVQREVEIALTKEIEGAVVKVLPILYKRCDVPPFLSPKLWLDFTSSTHYARNLAHLLRRLSPAPAIDSGVIVPWTPKAVRLGVLCGLVMTKQGKIHLADRFIRNLCELGKLWAEGKIQFAKDGAFVMEAAAKTIADPNGARTMIPLTDDETVYLFNHLSRQVLNLDVEIATRARILTLTKNGVMIHQDLTNEVMEAIASYGPTQLMREPHVRPFVLNLFVETVQARLMLYDPDNREHLYHLAMFLFAMFEKSSAYKDLMRMVRNF